MAILKDTVISGSLRATDTIYTTTAQFQILRAPTASNGTTYGPGSANNILKSNGTSVYWTILAASDIPTISITDKTSGTLPVTRGGTGSTSAAGARTNLELGSMAIETATDYLNISSRGTAITDNSNLDTDYNTPGIYYSYASDRTQTLSGTVPVVGSGFKLITSKGYRDITLRQFCSGSNMMLNYRSSQDNGTTWTNWYRFVFLPSNNDNTYTAIGGATQPIYVTSAGVITAGTALKALAYKDSLVASDIPTGISITGNAATATKSGVAAIWLYPENSNEINFGGTNTGSIIYFGLRAKDSRPKPTKFMFGSSADLADIQAKTLYLGGTTSYINSSSYTGNAANVTGTVAVDHGGTGSTTVTGARNNLELGNAKIFYGVCSTAAATTEKVVECSDFNSTELKNGAAILVTFTNTNTGARASLTMNVNNTGTKVLKKQINSSTSDLNSTGELIEGNTYLFVYNASFNSNAGAWVLMTADYNNTYDVSQVSSASGASRQMETAANGGLGSHRYTLEMMTLNQTWSAISAVSGSTDANQGTAVAKVASTANFLLNSPILYTSTNLYTAPGASNSLDGYTAVSFNLRYSIGTTASNVSLTIQKPVYLVGKINSDMITFKLDSTQWWTQDLPTTKDGKIYIFLGMAYSASNMYLYTYHPIYYHNGTAIKVYNPGLHIKDETLLTNDSNEYVSVTEASPAHIENAAACDAENVVINVEPGQDLNGYSSPWPAGGGVNKISPTAYTGASYNMNVGSTLTLSEATDQPTVSGNTITWPVATAWVGYVFKTGALKAGTYNVHADVTNTPNRRLTFYVVGSDNIIKDKTASTSSNIENRSYTVSDDDYIAFFATSDPAGTFVLKDLQVESGSSYTAWSPYSNICPINGWTDATVRMTSKNLCPLPQVGLSYNPNDGIYRTEATEACTEKISVDFSINTNYIVDTNIAVNYQVLAWDVNGDYVGRTAGRLGVDSPFTFTKTSFSLGTYGNKNYDNIASIAIRFYPSGTQNIQDVNNGYIQIEIGTTVTTYEPYKSRTIPISFPSSAGTIYGGTVDLVTRKCVITKKSYNAADLAGWRLASASSSETHKVWRIDDSAFSGEVSKAASWGMCSKYKSAFGIDPTNMPESSFITNGSGVLYICDSRFSTLDEFQASYSDCQLVLDLATPIEYNIPATSIPLFNGTNNIWINCGKISFDYHTNIYPVVIDKSGNLAIQVSLDANNNNSLTLGSTTLTEEQLQTLLSFTRAAGEEF